LVNKKTHTLGFGEGLDVVGHLDADAFYVSAERVRAAYLVGKPVGVLGNQGACVIAKSYEMKAAGVKTGMPVWDAKKLCPDGVYVKRDFRWYEVLSRRMLEVVKKASPKVEFYSVDGATRSSETAVRPRTTARRRRCVTDPSVWVKRPPPRAKETALAPG
jgi:nucleotidyltransferase/DNA polymerase involved in DNA repair